MPEQQLPEDRFHDLDLALAYLVYWIRQVNVAQIGRCSSRSVRWWVNARISHQGCGMSADEHPSFSFAGPGQELHRPQEHVSV